MSKTGEIPYSWAQIEEQIKEAILCQASILEQFGPWCDQNLVADYLCLDRNAYKGRSVEDVRPSELDISEHQITVTVRAAYTYAYQSGDDNHDFDSAWHDADGLLQGFPQTDACGEPSPFCTLNDFPLRRMLETFFARYGLFDSDKPESNDYSPTIRQLSLLSNMTVPAVRTSLSKEGFKLEKSLGRSRGNQEDSSFRLNHSDAKLWLSRRRGFIPQRNETDADRLRKTLDQILWDRDVPFPEVIVRIAKLRKISMDQLAERSGLETTWLSSLIAGQSVELKLDALREMACALKVSEADFVAEGVRYILNVQNADLAHSAG